MKNFRIKKSLLILFFATVLGFAACGGDSDSGGGEPGITIVTANTATGFSFDVVRKR